MGAPEVVCICPDLGKLYVSSQRPLCTPALGKGVLLKLQSYRELNRHGRDGTGESEKQENNEDKEMHSRNVLWFAVKKHPSTIQTGWGQLTLLLSPRGQ